MFLLISLLYFLMRLRECLAWRATLHGLCQVAVNLPLPGALLSLMSVSTPVRAVFLHPSPGSLESRSIQCIDNTCTLCGLHTQEYLTHNLEVKVGEQRLEIMLQNPMWYQNRKVGCLWPATG